MSVLAVENLGKRYRSAWALRGVTTAIERGEVLGFIGPNGAGKTTFLNMIVGLSPPSEGTVQLLGADPNLGVPPGLGYVADGAAFAPHLSAVNALSQIASVRKVADSNMIAATLDRVGLDPTSRKPTRAFSHGMRQWLNLAQALMERPELLILDEPSNGLDAEAIIALRGLITEIAVAGGSVVIASHLLTEIERVCDRVLLVAGGVVQKSLDLSALRRQTRIEFADARSAELGRSHRQARSGDGPATVVSFDSTDVPDLIWTLSGQGARIADVQPGSRILEQEFLGLVSGAPAL